MQSIFKPKYVAPATSLENKFKPYSTKSVIYTHSDTNFPELTAQSKLCGVNEVTDVNESTLADGVSYKSASTVILPVQQTEQNKLMPGWAYLKYDNRNIITNYKTTILKKVEQTFNEEANIAFNRMIYNWEKFKDDFIEVHGYEMYEALYTMPNYETPNFDDEDEDDESYDYYDSDDYDDYYGTKKNNKYEKFDTV